MYVKIKKVEGCITQVDDLKRRYPAFVGNRDFHGIPVVGQIYPLIETITIRVTTGKYLVCHVIGTAKTEIFCVPVDDCEIRGTSEDISKLPFGTGIAVYKAGSNYAQISFRDIQHNVSILDMANLHNIIFHGSKV